MAQLAAAHITASRGTERALQAAAVGQGISRDDAILLIENADLRELCRVASDLRHEFKGNTISYSRKVFIPLTHLCRDYCGYCTFRSDPVAGHPAYMSPDEVDRKSVV